MGRGSISSSIFVPHLFDCYLFLLNNKTSLCKIRLFFFCYPIRFVLDAHHRRPPSRSAVHRPLRLGGLLDGLPTGVRGRTFQLRNHRLWVLRFQLPNSLNWYSSKFFYLKKEKRAEKHDVWFERLGSGFAEFPVVFDGHDRGSEFQRLQPLRALSERAAGPAAGLQPTFECRCWPRLSRWYHPVSLPPDRIASGDSLRRRWVGNRKVLLTKLLWSF